MRETSAIRILFRQATLFLMMRDLKVLAVDPDVNHLLKAKEVKAVTTVEDATLDVLALKVPTVKATIMAEETMAEFSVEIAVDKEAVKEVVREVAREVAREEVKDMTTMIDLITTKRVEDLRLLAVVPGTTTIMMKIDHPAQDTTIKIMTIPAKIELAEETSTMLAADHLVNKIIMTIMITNLVMITEDLGETITIKTIVQMKNTRDLLEITDLNHPDSKTIRTTLKVSKEASEVASEEVIVMETSEEVIVMETSEEVIVMETSEETAEETLEVHLEETSEVATQLEVLVVSADRAVETTALEELALTNNEKGIFKRVLFLKCDDIYYHKSLFSMLINDHFLIIVIRCLALYFVKLFSLLHTNSKSGWSGNLFLSAGKLISV